MQNVEVYKSKLLLREWILRFFLINEHLIPNVIKIIDYIFLYYMIKINECMQPRNNWSILINFVEMVCECVFISYLFLSFLMEKV